MGDMILFTILLLQEIFMKHFLFFEIRVPQVSLYLAGNKYNKLYFILQKIMYAIPRKDTG